MACSPNASLARVCCAAGHSKRCHLVRFCLARFSRQNQALPTTGWDAVGPAHPVCSYSHYPGSIASLPRGCNSSLGTHGLFHCLLCLATARGAVGVVADANMVPDRDWFCSVSALLNLIPVCSTLLLLVQLAWLMAWLSCLPCLYWCSIGVLVIIIITARPINDDDITPGATWYQSMQNDCLLCASAPALASSAILQNELPVQLNCSAAEQNKIWIAQPLT
jgi:hypothetical protein